MFKSIQFFRLVPTWIGDLTTVENALEDHRFVECGASQERSIGWVEPRGEKHGPLVESIGGQWILKIMVETKILPGSVVKDALKERLEQTEAQTGRKPGKKEVREMREDIRNSLLAKAFTKKATGYVWIDPNARLLIIEAGSKSRSDEIVTLLVKSLEGFGVTLISTTQSPSSSMSLWLTTQEAPAGFSVDRDCALKANDESRSTVKYGKHTLDIDEIRAHIAQGKIPTQLAMTWNGRVSFMLTDTGMVKKIEFQEVVFDDGKDESGFDGDAAIVTGELSNLIPDLIDALGGESEVIAAVGPVATAEPTPNDEELFDHAVAVVRDNQMASVSLVQRHLKISYSQAQALLEKMEANGLVSALQDDGSRRVLDTAEV